MADIFLSYSSDDIDRVRPLVSQLESAGFTVWWDDRIDPGSSFDREIERELEAAKCVIVVWSDTSVDSTWVREEADAGLQLNKLVPLLIDDCQIPLGFRRVQAARLIGWPDGGQDLNGVLARVEMLVTGIQRSPTPEEIPARRIQIRPLTLAIILLLVAIPGVLWVLARPPDDSRQADRSASDLITRTMIDLPVDSKLLEFTQNRADIVAQPLAIDSNGEYVVFALSEKNGSHRLYRRRLTDLEATPIGGLDSDNIGNIALSPDSQWVVYEDHGLNKLRKISVSGGSPISLCDIPDYIPFIRGLSWSSNGDIVFTGANGLLRVSEQGGETRSLVETDGSFDVGSPRHTPDGESLIYTVSSDEGKNILLYDGSTGRSTHIMKGELPRLVSEDVLVYLDGDKLWAERLDSDYRPSGKRLSILSGATIREFTNSIRTVDFDVSTNGTLIYKRGANIVRVVTQLVWVDQNGAETAYSEEVGDYLNTHISPEGTEIAIGVRTSEEYTDDIWIYRDQGNGKVRLTRSTSMESRPIWIQDGRRLVFSSNQGAGRQKLRWKSSNATGPSQLLSDAMDVQWPTDWAPGLSSVLAFGRNKSGLAKISLVGIEGAQQTLLEGDPFSQRNPSISRDGKWIAYESNSVGDWQVFVRPYPDWTDAEWQVSIDGGTAPRWARDGSAIFFKGPEQMMRAEVTDSSEFQVNVPVPLFNLKPYRSSLLVNYDLADDGRFLMIKIRSDIQSETAREQIVLVPNWYSQLDRALSEGENLDH